MRPNLTTLVAPIVLVAGLFMGSGAVLAADPIATGSNAAASADAEPQVATLSPSTPGPEFDTQALLRGPSPGALWSERSARTLLGQDGNTRQVGDLVTVNIYESTSASLQAGTETSRTSTLGAKIAALFGIETSILKANPNMGPEISMETESSSSYNGSGTTRRESNLEGQLTCQIVEVLPTGNLRIRGSKEVRSNRELQWLVLEGVVRPRDIRADNTVDSYLLAEARIEHNGSGVVSDKQGPGIGTRIVDRVWPF